VSGDLYEYESWSLTVREEHRLRDVKEDTGGCLGLQ